MKRCLVTGAGGFIGHHLVKRLKQEGHKVIGIDLKYPQFEETVADHFLQLDLKQPESWNRLLGSFDEVYQLAADMGGAGFIFTGENDYDILHNSAQINLNCVHFMRGFAERIFFSSSACIYPAHNQENPDDPRTSEDSAYPANPDSEYGWEKLFSERLYASLGSQIRLARYHNIFGEYGTFQGGREKAPAALCRKVASSSEGDALVVWGDGKQTRSFLYIDDCIDATLKLMRSNYNLPLNIGSEEMVSIGRLAEIIIGISGKKMTIRHDPTKPQGVRGRTSDNRKIREILGWEPGHTLAQGLESTYLWISGQVAK